MKLNKILLVFLSLCIGISLYAKQKDLQKIEVDYLNFNQITLNNLFGFLSKEYKINFSVEPEYRQNTVSINIQNTNLKSLLDMVTRENGMVYKIKNNVIYVTPFKQELQKRFRSNDYFRGRITLSYASVTDTIKFLQDMMPGQAIVRSSTENRPYSNLFNATPALLKPSIDSNNDENKNELNDNNVYPVLKKEIEGEQSNQLSNSQVAQIDKTIPSDMLYIIPYFNNNKIFLLSSSKSLIEEAKELVADIDQPLKQVMIQGQIMEFTISDSFSSIFDFSYRSKDLVSSSKNPSSSLNFGNLQYTFLDSQLVANMEIAKRDGRASTVSSPMLLTMNRVSATLDLTEDISIVTGVKEGSTSTNEGTSIVIPPTPIYQTAKIGTLLTITPYINNEDEILLKVDVAISSKNGNSQIIKVPTTSGISEEYSVDGISTSRINTILTTANEKSIVFGGLIRKTVSKQEKRTPILGDIPILGIPFRDIQDVDEKKELIIVLTPTIVDLKDPNKNKSIKNIRNNVLETNKQKESFFKNSKDEDNATLLKRLREDKISEMFENTSSENNVTEKITKKEKVVVFTKKEEKLPKKENVVVLTKEEKQVQEYDKAIEEFLK